MIKSDVAVIIVATPNTAAERSIIECAA